MKRRHKIKIALFFILGFSWSASRSVQANCQDPELRQMVSQTAREEGVDEKELLSIIAHESGCHYYTVAWNQRGFPQTAKSKFLSDLSTLTSSFHLLLILVALA